MEDNTTAARVSVDENTSTDPGPVPPYTPDSSVYSGPWGDAAGATTTTTTTAPPVAQPSWKTRIPLRRSRSDRMLSGVCGGVAEALDVDAALIRIGLVLLTVFGVGAGAVAYVAAWILVPEAD